MQEAMPSDDEFEDADDVELTEDEKELIKMAKIVIIGGHCHLQKFLRDMFPHVRFVDAEPMAFDSNLVRTADIVCYLTNHLSHSTFKKVKNIATNCDIKQVYHRTNNVNFIYKTIARGLMEI